MKKMISVLLLCTTLMVGLTGCHVSVSKPDADSKTGVTVTTTTTEESDEAETAQE